MCNEFDKSRLHHTQHLKALKIWVYLLTPTVNQAQHLTVNW